MCTLNLLNIGCCHKKVIKLSIYYINGSVLTQPYNLSGSPLSIAYNTDGNVIFPDGPISLRVMSYNVGAWTAFGANATAENQETWYALQNSILSDEDSDLIGIQEYEDAIGSYSVPLMIRQYLPYLFDVDRVSGKAGRAIASKHPMYNAREINFANQNGEIRSYLIGDVSIGGKTIKFITAHLALDKSTIALQIQELLSAVESFDYWIVTGDFNINFPNVQSDGYSILIEPFLNEGYNVANGSDFGFIPTFSAKTPEQDTDWRYLDNIMCSSNIDITDVYVNRQKITDHAGYAIDHLPLVAEVVVN